MTPPALTDAPRRRGRPPPNKGKRYPPEALTGEEITAMLDALSKATAIGIRQRALIVVMWRAGLRIAEALALRSADVDLERGVIVVARRQTGRVVGVDARSLLYLRAWSEQRAELTAGHNTPTFFCTIGRDAAGAGHPLRQTTVRDALTSCAKAAGITKRVHPHGLRHTHVHELELERVSMMQRRPWPRATQSRPAPSPAPSPANGTRRVSLERGSVAASSATAGTGPAPPTNGVETLAAPLLDVEPGPVVAPLPPPVGVELASHCQCARPQVLDDDDPRCIKCGRTPGPTLPGNGSRALHLMHDH